MVPYALNKQATVYYDRRCMHMCNASAGYLGKSLLVRIRIYDIEGEEKGHRPCWNCVYPVEIRLLPSFVSFDQNARSYYMHDLYGHMKAN